MGTTSPVPVLVAYLTACLSVLVFARAFRITPQGGRISTIDGLRGYLGFGVYLHHAMIWFFYLKGGKWAVPPSNLYTQLGQTSVAFFFMVTGFLFYSKVLGERPVDWTRLFLSRVLRLMPLYLVVMGAMLCVVGVLSDWTLRVPVRDLLKDVAGWIVIRSPDVNGVDNTSTILARVTWTLRYEWAFYLCLPLIALASGRRPPVLALIVGAAGVYYIHDARLDLPTFMPFLSGMLAAFLSRLPAFRRVASQRVSSLVVVVGVGLVMTQFRTAYAPLPLAALTVAFSLVAAGSTVFGILTASLSRCLGEITYSIYLLHGLMLFVLFRFVIGLDTTAALPPPLYWAVIIGMTPVLILLSMVTFTFVEVPAIRCTDRATARIKALWPGRAAESASQGIAPRHDG